MGEQNATILATYSVESLDSLHVDFPEPERRDTGE
jgi:hypothetical protein